MWIWRVWSSVSRVVEDGVPAADPPWSEQEVSAKPGFWKSTKRLEAVELSEEVGKSLRSETRGSGVSFEVNAQILLKLITRSLLLHAIMSCFKKLFIQRHFLFY